jgi:tRNA(adenine34) deaminase
MSSTIPSPSSSQDTFFLQQALQQALAAAQLGEVPVGAVVVSPSGKVLGQACNRTISDRDPCAHAEILALRAAAQTVGNHRLEGCTLYVTLEPCAMCSGALLHARIARAVYAVPDPKTGAAGSVLDLFAHSTMNHQTRCEAYTPKDIDGHALQEACAEVLRGFFRERRMVHHDLRRNPGHAPLREDALRPPEKHFSHFDALEALRPWSEFVLLSDPEEAPGSTPWRMHVIDTAPGDCNRPVVLLLHGYASYSLLWTGLIPRLHTAGWRVLAPDLPGHGKSDMPKKIQRHHPAWHAALLLQWLQQAHFSRHANRAVILHDSAALLLPALAAGFPEMFPAQAIHLRPEESAAAWRQHCQQRTTFDLDAHWALNAVEAASGAWSAPWPDAGHRAALQWAQWAAIAEAPTQHGTIGAAVADVQTILTPASGATFRRWLEQHGPDLTRILKQRVASSSASGPASTDT